MANSDGSSSGGSFIGGLIGGVIGFFVGGGIQGAIKGFMYGSTIGGLLAPPTGPDQFGPRIDSLTITTSSNIATLPRSYGTVAHKGNLVWAKDSEYIEVATTKKVKTGLFSKTKVTTYAYFFTGAYAFHKGEIEGVLRIWHADRDLVYNVTSSDNDTLVASGELSKYITIYKGTADQMPDPLISEDVGAASCSAYRGVFYIVYNMYPLENYQNNVGSLDPKVEYTTKPLDDPSLELIVNVPADDVGGLQDHYAWLHAVSNLDADGAHLWRVGLGDVDGLTQSIKSYMYQAYPSGDRFEVGDLTPPLAGGEKAYNRPCAGKSDRRVMCASAVYLTAYAAEGGTGTPHPALTIPGEVVLRQPSTPASYDNIYDALTAVLGTHPGDPDYDYAMVFSTLYGDPGGYVTTQSQSADATSFTLIWDFTGLLAGRAFSIAASLDQWIEGPITADMYSTGYSYSTVHRLWVYDKDRNVVDQFVVGSAYPAKQTHYSYYNGKIYFVYVVGGVIQLLKIHHFSDGGELQSRQSASFNVDGMVFGDPVTINLVKIGMLNDQLIFVCEEAGACILYTLDISTNLDGLDEGLTEEVMTVMDSAAVLAEFGDNSSDFYNNISFDFDQMFYCLGGHVYARSTLTGTERDLGAAPDLILGDTYPAFFNIYSSGNLLAVSTFGGVMDKTGVQFFRSGGVADPGKVLLADIITAECALVGLEASDIDVTTIDQEVRGYTVSEIGPVRNVLSQLQACFPFDIIQSGYKVKFVKRGSASVATISWEDLGEGVSLAQDREMEIQLPWKVELTYLDKELNYEGNVQFSERPIQSQNITRLNIPIVFIPDEAAPAVDILHSNYVQERKGFAFKLPPTYRHLEPADVITLEMQDVSHVVRLANMNYLANGSIECAAKEQLPTTYTSSSVGASGPARPDTIPSIANPIHGVLDIPVINDIQNKPGYTAVVTHTSDTWIGGSLYRARDGVTFEQVQAFNDITVWGTCSTVLAAHGGHVIDEGSTLTVKPYKGTIASVTETQFLNEETLLAYGKPGRWEIIGFKTADANSDGTCTLSYLMRGRRGTEQYTGTHEVGDYFGFVNNGTSKFVAALATDIDQTLTHKAITTGRDLDTASPSSLTYAGVNLTPLSPVHAFANRDGSGNVTGYFTRRSRVDGGMSLLESISYGGVPLGETTESYEIDVMDGATVVRTITATSETFTYSAANQTTDFGSAQAAIDINIYQISATVGRGYALEATI